MTISSLFPLVTISLAEACVAFIAPEKLVLSLKGGEIYVLTLLTDGLRSIRSFHFDKAAGMCDLSLLLVLFMLIVFVVIKAVLYSIDIS